MRAAAGQEVEGVRDRREDRFQAFDGAFGGAGKVADQRLTDGAADGAGEHAVGDALLVAHQAHGFGHPGGFPLDDRPRALRRQVTRAEAGPAGGDDEACEPLGHLPECFGHCFGAVLGDAVLDNGISLADQSLGEGAAGEVVAGSGDDTVRHGEDVGDERHGR